MMRRTARVLNMYIFLLMVICLLDMLKELLGDDNHIQSMKVRCIFYRDNLLTFGLFWYTQKM